MSDKLDLTKQVRPVKTPFGEPWNHREIVLRMDSLLRRIGISRTGERVRMTANAIFASGWKQNVWWFNAWGVKRGSWKGNWYTMKTLEARKDGSYYAVDNATWRAFDGWRQAVEDFQGRISPDSGRAGYREAYEHLVDETSPVELADAAYWDALGAGGYYTDKKFKGANFASLCARVRSELESATREERANAELWAAEQVKSSSSPTKMLTVLGLVVAGLALARFAF